MQLPVTITKEFQQSLTPADILNILHSGNERFVQQTQCTKDIETQRKTLHSAQYPIAVILGCIDSRAPSEIIFDVGLGTVFNIRIAGNIMNQDILGSIEFATKVAGAKLILVMGHTDCGAIRAACNNVELGNITAIINKIKPVICDAKKTIDETHPDFVDSVISHNAQYVGKQILQQSPIVQELIQNGSVEIRTAVYNIATGVVDFHNAVE